MVDKSDLMRHIDDLSADMAEALAKLIEIPAISPDEGGCGELDKVVYLDGEIRRLGFPAPVRYDAPDPRAKGGVRPSLVVTLPGASATGRLVIMSHTDVVPAGDCGLWKTDPFKGLIRDGKVIGRGSEDNGQALIASLYAAYVLKENNVAPSRDVLLVFVADEEKGSKYGIRYLLEQGIFRNDDLILVPDGGSEDGGFIEVAEKSILWLEFTVTGKQCHASRPDHGLNACRAANELSVALDRRLHEVFAAEDSLFSYPKSTFEPTRRKANVANINTIPGTELFAFDCRVLPCYKIADVMKVFEEEIDIICNKYGVSVSYKAHQSEDAPTPTSPDAPVVKMLSKIISETRGITPTVGGVGGGTCAAYFRAKGIPACVWQTEAGIAHQPDEYTLIDNITADAKVFLACMIEE